MSHIEIYNKVLLGQGAFGEVLLGRRRDTKALVAVKRESKKSRPVLEHENKIILLLNGIAGIQSIAFWEDKRNYYMSTPLHGPSLDSIQKICNGRFSLRICLTLGIEMISIIEQYHNRGIIHRDIKPANFLIDYHSGSRIYLIDFGLAKRCLDNDDRHIPYREKAVRVGSLRYMSKHVHMAIESSYRDDIYSIGYVLIYLYLNDLPWRSSVKELTIIEKHKKILDIKQKISNSRLVLKLSCKKCNNVQCPFIKCMKNYLDYADSLEFGQTVNYGLIVKWFKDCLFAHEGCDSSFYYPQDFTKWGGDSLSP